jgi:hypothetical protein
MRLYPRLAHHFADEVFKEFRNFPLTDLRSRSAVEHPLMTWPATGASRAPEAGLAALAQSLRGIADDYGFPEPPSAGSRPTIDRALARGLWNASELTPAEAAFPDVWSFIALVLVPDVTWWRAAGSTNVERFVASDLTRHTLARLWWRAHLFTYGLADPDAGWSLWETTPIGEADLDQIQTRRGSYGASPKTFRALVRAYPTDARSGRRELWRHSFLAWLLRIGAFVDFNALEEDELTDDLGALAGERMTAAYEPQPSDSDKLSDPEQTAVAAATFDSILLRDIVVTVAEAVRAHGSVSDVNLHEVFEHNAGVSVPPKRRDVLRGIAWQGKTLGYLNHNNERAWVIGASRPAPDRRWGDWSIDGFRVHVAQLNGEADAETLQAELFAGRPGRTVKRLVKALIKEAEAVR